MGGMEGGGCVACTKPQGCKGLHQGNEELLRLSTGTQGMVRGGGCRKVIWGLLGPAWSLDFTQSINSGSGEL